MTNCQVEISMLL